MPKRIVLHIGLHKTGTTSIQVALTCSRAQLSAQGWCYPLSGVPDWAPFGQHMLPWSIFTDEAYLPVMDGRRAFLNYGERNDLWSTLREEIDNSRSPSCIISSEEFDVLNRNEIFDLSSKLSGYDTEVVIFLRNFSDLVDSSYRMMLLYSDYAGDIASFASQSRIRLDLHEMLGDWAAAFGVERLHILNYDSVDVKLNSLGAFAKVAGFDESAFEPIAVQRQNESLPAFACEVLRFLRLQGLDIDCLSQTREAMNSFRFGSDNASRYSHLSSEMRMKLDARFVEEVQRIIQDPSLGSRMPYGIGAFARAENITSITCIADALVALLSSWPLKPSGGNDD